MKVSGGLRRGLALLGSLWLIAATPAAAAVMQVSMGSEFNDDAFYDRWFATFTYDTALMSLTEVPGGQSLYWDISSGAPAPIQSVNVTVEAAGSPGPGWFREHTEDDVFVAAPDVDVIITGITYVQITRPADFWHFRISAGGAHYNTDP